MQFEQHGDYKIWTKNNMLYAELSGAWNQEAAENFEADFMKAAKHLPAPWAHIAYLNDWELCSPDTFPVIARLVEWCIQHDLTRAANIFSPSSLKEGFLNKMVVDEQDSFKRIVFDNEEDAVEWLKNEGFKAEAQK